MLLILTSIKLHVEIRLFEYFKSIFRKILEISLIIFYSQNFTKPKRKTKPSRPWKQHREKRNKTKEVFFLNLFSRCK